MRCCALCNSTILLEEHHTIPRSLGGHQSRLVTLCKECHNFIHRMAIALTAKDPSQDPDRLWSNYLQHKPALNQIEAKRLIATIVQASLQNEPDYTQTVQITLPRILVKAARRAAKDQGVPFDTFVKLCIAKELRRLGWRIHA